MKYIRAIGKLLLTPYQIDICAPFVAPMDSVINLRISRLANSTYCLLNESMGSQELPHESAGCYIYI
jgi:hypothetical protein